MKSYQIFPNHKKYLYVYMFVYIHTYVYAYMKKFPNEN